MQYVLYFCGGIVFLFILSWIYARLSEKGNPRRSLNRIGRKLYSKIIKREIENAKKENRLPDDWYPLRILYAEIREQYPGYALSDIYTKEGKYLSDLVLEESTIYGKFISSELEHSIKSIALKINICALLVLVKVAEEKYGKEEARKYAYDILIGRLE